MPHRAWKVREIKGIGKQYRRGLRYEEDKERMKEITVVFYRSCGSLLNTVCVFVRMRVCMCV